MGDSLIFRYNIKQFFPEFTSLNRGIGGDTTFGLEKRLKVSCFDVKSKIVLMLIGINNIKTMFENYENILIKLKNNINDRKIIICSLTPMSKRNKKNNKFAVENNKKLKILAQKYDFIFLDLYKPLLDIKTNQIIDTFTIDGLHFSFEGYKVITQEIKNVLNKNRDIVYYIRNMLLFENINMHLLNSNIKDILISYIGQYYRKIKSKKMKLMN